MIVRPLTFTLALLMAVMCVLIPESSGSSGSSPDLLHVLDMEEEHKQQWVDAHNYYRRQVSAPEAANMRLITWDDGLAALAESVVRTCSFTHTSIAGLQTSVFSRAGENLYTGGNYRFSEMMALNGITKLWYDEVQHFTFSSVSCETNEMCGHYKQVVWANTYKVGCAIASCSAIESGHTPFLVSCNYGPEGNQFLHGTTAIAPYISGAACSQCDAGDLCIEGLCNNTARDIPFIIPLTTTAIPTTTPILTTTPISTTITSTQRSDSATNEATTHRAVTSEPCVGDPCTAVPSSPTTSGGDRASKVGALHFYLILLAIAFVR